MPDRPVTKALDVQAALKEPTLKVEKTDAFMTAFVGINSQHPPLDKPEVRQAINLAFDKANYVKAVFEDTAEPPMALIRRTPGVTRKSAGLPARC